MDLASLEPAKEGTFVVLRHPASNEPLKTEAGELIGLTLVGTDSEPFRARQRASVNKRLRAGRKIVVTAESVEEDAIETLAACIVGWRNVILDGKAIDHSHEAAKALLRRLPFIRDQVDEAIADRANFLKASPTT